MFATHSNAGIQASSIENFPFVLLGGMSSPIVEGLRNAIPFRGMFFCIAAGDIWRIPSGNSGLCFLSNNQPQVSQSTLTFEAFIETKYMPFVEKRMAMLWCQRLRVEILKHFDGGIKYFDSPRFSNTLTVW